MSSLIVPEFTLWIRKGFAGLFLHGKKKHCKKAPLLFFPAATARLWLMPCHFQPLNQRLSLVIPSWGSKTSVEMGSTDRPIGTLSSRSIRNEESGRKVLKTIKKYKLTPAVSLSVTIHQFRRMLCFPPVPPAPRSFLFNTPTFCFCLPQGDSCLLRKLCLKIQQDGCALKHVGEM